MMARKKRNDHETKPEHPARSPRKPTRMGNRAHRFVQQRQALIEQAPVQRAELVDLHTSNSAIIQQLKMITAYPYILNEDLRRRAVEAVEKCLMSDSLTLQLQAAMVVAKLTSVNLSTFKQLASDQVQKHLSFDRVDPDSEAKLKALDSLTDEELDVLQKVADRAGGSVPISRG